MKEATGELNMTVVTIVAIAAVAALFYVFLWPTIQKSIVGQTCKTYGADWKAWKVTDTSVNGTSSEKAFVDEPSKFKEKEKAYDEESNYDHVNMTVNFGGMTLG